MKTKIKCLHLLSAILMALSFNTQHANGAAYVVGLSPYYETSQRAVVLQYALTFLLEGAAPGDSITFCDALNQRLVTSCTIPTGSLFLANARARAQRLASPMASLKEFVMTERAYPATMANVIALPQFLDFAATQLRHPAEPLRIICLASPLYIDTNPDAACSMQSAFPSDATLTATPDQSVFGCAYKKTVLSGVAVHYAFLNAAFLNDYHQERITRFWTLYCQQAGGVLATFCADPVLAFRRAKDNIQQPCVEAHLDLTDTKIEMRQVLRRSVVASRSITNDVGRLNSTSDLPNVTTVVTAPAPTADASVAQGPTTQGQPATASVSAGYSNGQITYGDNTTAVETAKLAEAFPVKPAARSFGVGIAWSAAADLDIWVQPRPGTAELSFHHTLSAEGRYLHDWRHGNLGLDYEYVLLNPDQPVDLATIGCWVNYYAGRVSPVRGIVVVHYEGRAYQGEFTLNAPGGNQAGERDKRQRSRYWVRLDLASIVKANRSFESANVSH